MLSRRAADAAFPDDTAHMGGWLTAGGPPFINQTMRVPHPCGALQPRGWDTATSATGTPSLSRLGCNAFLVYAHYSQTSISNPNF
jgi:hypothetical protein